MKKYCSKCKKEKSLSEFSINRTKKDGLQGECKKCRKKYDKKYRQRPEMKKQRRKYKLVWRYNLTLEQYQQMYIDQNGCCLICKKSISYDRTCIDHNHQTNEVRGLLCYRCNIGLSFVENENLLRVALEYLEKNK